MTENQIHSPLVDGMMLQPTEPSALFCIKWLLLCKRHCMRTYYFLLPFFPEVLKAGKVDYEPLVPVCSAKNVGM